MRCCITSVYSWLSSSTSGVSDRQGLAVRRRRLAGAGEGGRAGGEGGGGSQQYLGGLPIALMSFVWHDAQSGGGLSPSSPVFSTTGGWSAWCSVVEAARQRCGAVRAAWRALLQPPARCGRQEVLLERRGAVGARAMLCDMAAISAMLCMHDPIERWRQEHSILLRAAPIKLRATPLQFTLLCRLWQSDRNITSCAPAAAPASIGRVADKLAEERFRSATVHPR